MVPYSATSLEDAESIIHVIKKSENDLRKQQVSGFYRDVELGRPADNESALEKKERELFEMLINLSGIGPKTALSIIGHLNLNQPQSAVHKNDISAVSKVPGIGKKTA